jgi:Protein of unknown function (DUF1566)
MPGQFTNTGTNPGGKVSLINNSNSGNLSFLAPPAAATYTIGQAALGGTIAYILQSGDPGYSPSVQHGLVATVADVSSGARWGCIGTLLSGANGAAIGTGNQNTIDIVAQCAEPNIAARLCSDLTEGGYSDWYLPSVNELKKLYTNKTAIGGFAINSYWSSTQDTANQGLTVFFIDGSDVSSLKNNSKPVRAIRSF